MLFGIATIIFVCGLVVIGIMVARKARRVYAKASPTLIEFDVERKENVSSNTN